MFSLLDRVLNTIIEFSYKNDDTDFKNFVLAVYDNKDPDLYFKNDKIIFRDTDYLIVWDLLRYELYINDKVHAHKEKYGLFYSPYVDVDFINGLD